jgi:hypothetical protein
MDSNSDTNRKHRRDGCDAFTELHDTSAPTLVPEWAPAAQIGASVGTLDKPAPERWG